MWKALSDVARPFKIKRERLEKFVDDSKESVNKLWKSEQVQSVVRSAEKLKDAGVKKLSEGEVAARGKGLSGKIKEFRHKIKGLPPFQKLLLLTIAVCMPAGILIAVALTGFIKSHGK